MDTAAIHASTSNLIMEHFEYDYSPGGEPVIYLIAGAIVTLIKSRTQSEK